MTFKGQKFEDTSLNAIYEAIFIFINTGLGYINKYLTLLVIMFYVPKVSKIFANLYTCNPT